MLSRKLHEKLAHCAARSELSCVALLQWVRSVRRNRVLPAVLAAGCCAGSRLNPQQASSCPAAQLLRGMSAQRR